MSKNRLDYFNDTNNVIRIHPATLIHGCEIKDDKTEIQPLEIVTFYLPEGTYPWVKVWSHGTILVSPQRYPEEEII